MKKRKVILILMLILALLVIVFIGRMIFNKYMKSKFAKMLNKSDSKNYEITEKHNGNKESIKVRNGILISDNTETCIWVDSLKKKRVVMDKVYKTAIVTENDDNLSVNSLNYTYLKDYFENSNNKFKYLGKEDKYYKIQFKNKKTGVITAFYLNKDTNIIEKMIQNKNNIEIVIEFEINLNSVSEAEVQCPDLSEYKIANSSSTVVDESLVKESREESSKK